MEGLKEKIKATFFYILVKLNFHSSLTRANRGSGCMVKNPCERTVGDLKYVWSGSVCYTEDYEIAVIEQGTQKNYSETYNSPSILFIICHFKIKGNLMVDIKYSLTFCIESNSVEIIIFTTLLSPKLIGNTINPIDYNNAIFYTSLITITIFQNRILEMSENEGDAEPGAIAGTIDSRILDDEGMDVTEDETERMQLEGGGSLSDEEMPDSLERDVVEVAEAIDQVQIVNTVKDTEASVSKGPDHVVPAKDPVGKAKIPAWRLALLGEAGRHEAVVGVKPAASGRKKIDLPDPYAEFIHEQESFRKLEKHPNPLNSLARSSLAKLKITDSPKLDYGDEPDELLDRRRLVRKFFRGHVEAMPGAGKPEVKVAYEATFRGDVCLTCDHNNDDILHHFGTDVRAVVVGDAHVPPLIGAEGRCIGVVRIASGSPEQLASALIEVISRPNSGHKSNKRKADGSKKNPEIHVMWAVNTHMMRVGVTRALHDLRSSQGMVLKSLGPHFEVSSCLILVPNGHDERADDGGCSDTYIDNSVTVATHNHALRLLSRLVMDEADKAGNSSPVLVEGFDDAFAQMHVGEAVNKHGMEVNVEANHPVLRNRDAIYIPSNVKIMTVYPGVKSDPEKHLVLEPRTEYKFLTSLVRELKNTHKFKSHRSLPENIHILAGVCLGIPRGNSQQDDMGKHVVDELVAYAGKLHADLLRTGNAHGMFDPTSIYKLAPKFKPTGKLVVVGASEAREFTNRVETAKTQILAENTWSVKRNYVTGSSQEMSQSLVERAFKKVQDDQGDHTVVIWILSNLMMIDRNGVLNIRTETHKEYRDRMEAIAQEKYGLKYEARRLRMGRVFKGKIPIHLLNSRMRTEGEVNDLLVDVCRRVNQLAVQRKGQVIVVGPMPRHPSRCCDDNEHMQKGFVSSDYTKRCYLISSFLELVLEQKNIYVLHPGQVYGWDREPAVSKVVANDGVHLNDDAKRRVMKIIVDRLDSFQHVPESTEADTSKDAGTAEVEEAEGKLGPEDYLTKFLPDMDNFIYVKPVSYPDFEL